jgi:CDP-diacylglycerol--glycerol-3-phosphate 3-phosphatidyltransferase
VIAIPICLTILRLLLGPVIIAMAMTHQGRMIFGLTLVIGMLSDIFDGVLARQFGVARPWLRRFDSATDIVYYGCVFVATWFAAPKTIVIFPLVLLAASELVCIAFSFVRFGAMPATHTYAAKIYGIAIFGAFLAVLGFGFGGWVFWLLAIVGLAANIDIIIILGVSRTAPVDVPSIFRLKQRRR